MFDTLKALFFSVYGVFVLLAFFLGTLWCLFAYARLGLVYPLSYVGIIGVYALWDDAKRSRAKNKDAPSFENIQKAREELVKMMPKHEDTPST